MDAAFYCMSSELYFPGAVGLVNSLRLAGHDGADLPARLRADARAPARCSSPTRRSSTRPTDTPPYLLKTVAPRRHPADVDGPDRRRHGRHAPARPADRGAADGAGSSPSRTRLDRFVPEWGELLGLGELRRGPYVSSGLVGLGGRRRRPRSSALWDDRLSRSTTSAPTSPTTSPATRSATSTRTCSTRSSRRASSPTASRCSTGRSPRASRTGGCGCSTRRRCAARYRDGTEPYVAAPVPRQAVARADATTGSTRGCSRACCSADDVAIRMPAEEVPAADARGARGARRAQARRRRRPRALVRARRDPEWIADAAGRRAASGRAR